MRKLGTVVFVFGGLYLVTQMVSTLNYGLSFFLSPDTSYIPVLITFAITVFFIAAGVLMIIRATELSKRVFPDDGLETAVTAQELLRVILISFGLIYGFSQLLSIIGLAISFLGAEGFEISFSPFIASLLGVVGAGLLIYYSSQISAFFFSKNMGDGEDGSAGI